MSSLPQLISYFDDQLTWFLVYAKLHEKQGTFTFKVPFTPRFIATVKPECVVQLRRLAPCKAPHRAPYVC